MLTHDTDFKYIVSSVSSTIEYPICNVQMQVFWYWMKIMLDFHPDLNCTIKMFSKRGQMLPTLDRMGTYTWDYVQMVYNGVFVVDTAFK